MTLMLGTERPHQMGIVRLSPTLRRADKVDGRCASASACPGCQLRANGRLLPSQPGFVTRSLSRTVRPTWAKAASRKELLSASPRRMRSHSSSLRAASASTNAAREGGRSAGPRS